MTENNNKPTEEEAQKAVRTLIQWAGDDPDREGLKETPKRVVKAYLDWFSGYQEDPYEYLKRTFEDVDGYDEMVTLRGITFESHCEHHIALITGKAYVAYLPDHKVIGISKLARVVDAYSRRFQVQEKMTAQIANCINDVLKPIGVGKSSVDMVTSTMLGGFRTSEATRMEFMKTLGNLTVD